MNVVKSIVIAGAALAISAPAFAGRDLTDQITQQRAVKKLQAEKALAGAKGPQGQVGPQTKRPAVACAGKHPSERVNC